VHAVYRRFALWFRRRWPRRGRRERVGHERPIGRSGPRTERRRDGRRCRCARSG